MPTLYIHMGTPKTATTSIQRFLEENQERFREEGYSYPLLDFVYPHVQHRRNGHFLVGKVFYPDKTENVELEKELWERGLSMVHGEFEKYPNVILSDENIWHASRGPKFAFWEKIKTDAREQGYDIKVIVYLRRQDGMANSWLSQQVKEAWNTYSCIKWESYKKNFQGIVLHYYDHLEKIASVIGRENIIVRVFERGKFKGKGNTIFSDFLEAIGLEYKDEYQITEVEANKSLTGNSQEIMRVVNSVLPDDPKVRSVMQKAAKTCEALKDEENHFTMFSKEELEEFLKCYEQGNQLIAKEYLGQDEPLFDMKIKEGECWTPENRFMYEDIIRFFADIIVRQQECINKMNKNLSEIRKEAKDRDREMKRELEKMIKELREDVFFYRLKRKMRHISGKDQEQ